jgi:uncharacterized protein (DUF2252 family)
MPPSPAPTERTAALKARQALKMARSAQAYVRGSTERFYEWIRSAADGRVPQGPAVWICGDCHVGNLGPIGHPAGKAVVELRDLDQSVIGNPAHDVVRLVLSLAMAARSSDLPGVTTTRITEDLLTGYKRAFEGDAPSEAIDDLPSPIRLVMKRAVRRTWKRLFKERLGDGRVGIPIGRQFWRLADDERAAVRQLVALEPIRRLVTILESRADHARISFIDAAFWVKGCSSLGLWRAAVLVEIADRSKKGRPRRTLSLLDIKQAVDASAPWAPGADPRLDPAERVLTGARKLAPALGTRMVAATMLDRSVFIRELLPQDLKVELERVSAKDARAVAFYLGMVLGRAHSRQLDGPNRRAWHREMAHRTKTLDAPSWLWQALIDLVAIHEHAYLEHCRQYALAADRAGERSAAALDPERRVIARRRDGQRHPAPHRAPGDRRCPGRRPRASVRHSVAETRRELLLPVRPARPRCEHRNRKSSRSCWAVPSGRPR